MECFIGKKEENIKEHGKGVKCVAMMKYYMQMEQDMKVILILGKEKDLENVFGIKINIMKEIGKNRK